jgi:hypothetical protein
MGTISGYKYLKMNLKAKLYIYVKSTIQSCPNKIIEILQFEDFFHLPPVSTTPVVHLELPISSRIFEKIRNGLNAILYLGAWGNEKNQKSKISWHYPFNRNNSSGVLLWQPLLSRWERVCPDLRDQHVYP